MSDPDLISGCQPGGAFAGLTQQQLQVALAKAQLGLIDLLSGNKGESFSYAQGDGAKAVTYTRANIGGLYQLIAALQVALGNCCARRRPIRPIYSR